MKASHHPTLKRREIHFTQLHPSANQAEDGVVLLQDKAGVLSCEAVNPQLLAVEYDLREIGFAEIQCLLVGAGLHLASHLLHKIRRALYCYAEETQLANLGCPRGKTNCTDQVFITQYQRKDHGCRDARPEHWRRYL